MIKLLRLGVRNLRGECAALFFADTKDEVPDNVVGLVLDDMPLIIAAGSRFKVATGEEGRVQSDGTVQWVTSVSPSPEPDPGPGPDPGPDPEPEHEPDATDDVCFYNGWGELIASETYDEFMARDAMPEFEAEQVAVVDPDGKHIEVPMTCEGWFMSLEAAKAQLELAGFIDIAQRSYTTDGAAYFFMKLPADAEEKEAWGEEYETLELYVSDYLCGGTESIFRFKITDLVTGDVFQADETTDDGNPEVKHDITAITGWWGIKMEGMATWEYSGLNSYTFGVAVDEYYYSFLGGMNDQGTFNCQAYFPKLPEDRTISWLALDWAHEYEKANPGFGFGDGYDQYIGRYCWGAASIFDNWDQEDVTLDSEDPFPSSVWSDNFITPAVCINCEVSGEPYSDAQFPYAPRVSWINGTAFLYSEPPIDRQCVDLTQFFDTTYVPASGTPVTAAKENAGMILIKESAYIEALLSSGVFRKGTLIAPTEEVTLPTHVTVLGAGAIRNPYIYEHYSYTYDPDDATINTPAELHLHLGKLTSTQSPFGGIIFHDVIVEYDQAYSPANRQAYQNLFNSCTILGKLVIKPGSLSSANEYATSRIFEGITACKLLVFDVGTARISDGRGGAQFRNSHIEEIRFADATPTAFGTWTGTDAASITNNSNDYNPFYQASYVGAITVAFADVGTWDAKTGANALPPKTVFPRFAFLETTAGTSLPSTFGSYSFTWYATLADAKAGTNPLPANSMAPVDGTYYADYTLTT